jgi:hypothetical protein
MVNEWNGREFRMCCPGGPYIEFGARTGTKKRFPRSKGRMPKKSPS